MTRYFYAYNETTNTMDLQFTYTNILDPFSKARVFFCFLFFLVSITSLYFGKKAYDIRKKVTFFTIIAIIDSIGSILKVIVIGTEFVRPTSFIQIGVLSFLFNFNYILIHISVSALVFYWIHKYHDHIKKRGKSWSSMFVCLVFLSFNTFGILVCFIYAYSEANKLCDSQFYRSTAYIVNIIYFLADVCYAGSLFVYGFLIGKNHKKSLGVSNSNILVCSIALGVTFLYNAVELFTTAFISSLSEAQSMLFDITDLSNILIIYLCIVGIVHFDTEVKIRYVKKIENPNNLIEKETNNGHNSGSGNDGSDTIRSNFNFHNSDHDEITINDINNTNNINNILQNSNNNNKTTSSGGAGGISPIIILNSKC